MSSISKPKETLSASKKALQSLGLLFNALGTSSWTATAPKHLSAKQQLHFTKIAKLASHTKTANSWFTENNLRFCFSAWAKTLSDTSINQWLSPYTLKARLPVNVPKQVAVIMAGNIPLVGLHDCLSVLISGHNLIAKNSSKDTGLIPAIITFLEAENPYWQAATTFTKDTLSGFDAVIATGSNNTARYFEYYFGKYPHIIRKNRHSLAVLTGNESKADLQNLCIDIFQYFGLGCRNVSKLLVPNDYDFDLLFNAFYEWQTLMEHAKYMNNYDYNKAVYLMNAIPVLDNGFVFLKEDSAIGSPIGTLFYEYYSNANSLQTIIEKHADTTQCVVGNHATYIPFGATQEPNLWDYADAVNTLDFLLKLQ